MNENVSQSKLLHESVGFDSRKRNIQLFQNEENWNKDCLNQATIVAYNSTEFSFSSYINLFVFQKLVENGEFDVH